MTAPPSFESPEVTSNDCVKTLEALVKQITPYYKTLDRYVFELSDKRTAEPLLNNESRKNHMLNEVIVAINKAADINNIVQGIYGRVRDTVNAALEDGTTEVTINATDEKYGGCTVSTEYAQAILDEMLDQKNDAETMIGFMYQSYNDILVPKFPDVFKPRIRPFNKHCDENVSYFARKRAYEKVLEPMTKKLSELQGEYESKWHYNIRKWLQKRNRPYATDTLQRFVDAAYDAELIGENIDAAIIKDNCYKSLTPEEHKWVIREVDVRKKKNEIDVYMIDKQPERCKTIMRLLFRILFAYEYQGEDLKTYNAETTKLINSLDIHMMKLLVAIPETCIFTFPTDTESEYIHSVTLETVLHSVDYNQNWEVDAAYMYWFWTHLQGESYKETTDQEGKKRAVPATAKQGIDYFNTVFKPKLITISEKMANKLIGINGIYDDKESAQILAPWIVKTFDDAFNDYARRNTLLSDLIAQADGMGVRLFIDWFHSTVIHGIPKGVWKAFNAMSGEKRLQSIPIQFVPNNFTLFDKEYELETALITTINSLYWLYGYISEPDGNIIKDKPVLTPYRKYIYQGGLCYKFGKNPVIFNASEYEPFVLQWNPKYTAESYVPANIPEVDTLLINVKGEWFFDWTTAQISFMTQGIGRNIRPIDVSSRVPYIGARCLQLPYDTYIVGQLLAKYKETPGCPYSAKDNTLKNQWLFTYADHISGKYINGENTLINIMFNGTVRRLMRCSLTFPYNNIISTSFINAAHFGWAGKAIPTNGNDKIWDEVILPQYIFNRSVSSDNDGVKSEPNFDKEDNKEYKSVVCKVMQVSQDECKRLNMTFYVCDGNKTIFSGTEITCN
jgi:hypothetical protein